MSLDLSCELLTSWTRPTVQAGALVGGGFGTLFGATAKRRYRDALERLHRWIDVRRAGEDGKETPHRDPPGLAQRIIGDSAPRDVHSHKQPGPPWTGDGFRTSWGKELDRDIMLPLREAGLVFHGLRKSAVVFLLEAGCTDAEVSAITGQSRAMVEHYARRVNQQRLAAAAVLKWEAVADGGTGEERNL